MNLRKYLDDNDISTKDFAQKVGVTRAMLHRYMSETPDGKRVIPSFKVMQRITKATDYEVSIGSFYLEDRLEIRQRNKLKKGKVHEKPTRNC